MADALSQVKSMIPPSGKRLFHRFRNRFILGKRFEPGITRLHLGCGDNLLQGWANIDFNANAGVIGHNLTRPLPLEANTIEFIYTEHFIEHITRDEGVSFVTDCYRVLKPGGVLRISTPNLRRLIDDYLSGSTDEWKEWDWAPETSCQMVNGGMRLWGHQFVYDHDELERLLGEAGFNSTNRTGWRESQYEELRGLETRKYYDDVILEAVK